MTSAEHFQPVMLPDKFRTCSTDVAEYSRSVPYWTFPAQFFSFSPAAYAKKGESTGVDIAAESSLRKTLLSMAKTQFSKTPMEPNRSFQTTDQSTGAVATPTCLSAPP